MGRYSCPCLRCGQNGTMDQKMTLEVRVSTSTESRLIALAQDVIAGKFADEEDVVRQLHFSAAVGEQEVIPAQQGLGQRRSFRAPCVARAQVNAEGPERAVRVQLPVLRRRHERLGAVEQI